MKMKLFDNININASTADTAARGLPSLPRELREIRSFSEFQRNLSSKTRQIPKASADKWWNVASKARGRGGEKKKCRCFSAATTCTLGARFFSRITPKNYSGWGIVVHLRAV